MTSLRRLRHFLPWALLYFVCSTANGLKCRAGQEVQQNTDFEYVVRMCLRHLRNESDFSDSIHRMQNDYDPSRNKRHRDEMSSGGNSNNDNRNYYNRNPNRGYPEGFDRFWSPNEKPYNDRNRYGEEDRNRQDGDYDESDYFSPSRNGKDGRKKFKSRPHAPHSYQQQLQHDRDMMYGHGSRDSTNYFYTNRNKNTKLMFNKENNNDSPLADIDPCVIHCIFQEMQMVDDSGKPNKMLISQKMTQKIRSSELKTFIQDSVEECFDAIDDNDFSNYNNNNNNYHRKQESMCEWAKTFAMCLEARGRQNCEDWNEPIQKNNSYNNNNNNNNSNNNNNNNNNKNNEDQKHKSKQNERG